MRMHAPSPDRRERNRHMSFFSKMSGLTFRPAELAPSPTHCWRVWMFSALLLLTTATLAQAPGSGSSALTLPADPEPITPIPPAPVADPEKLALGKRILEQARLYHDASRYCESGHDAITSATGAHKQKVRSIVTVVRQFAA